MDPWALLQPGFWLSFVAVGLLIASESVVAARPEPGAPSRGLKLRGALLAGLRTQATATIGLAPLSMVFFQQVSVVGFVANLVAIPLVTLVITPLALLGVLLPPLWLAAAGLAQALNAVLLHLTAWPLAVWSAAAAPSWGVACGLFGGALLLLPLPWRLRLLGRPMLLPLLAPPVERPSHGRFEFVAADIGQGTAALVRTREHLLVWDTDPQTSPEADAGQRVLLPLLRARGETAVDLLVLSHRDTDHVGGAASLLAGRRVLASTSSPAVSPRAGAEVERTQLRDPGQRRRRPPAAAHRRHRSGTGGRAGGPPGRGEVLLVPHHGSRASSVPAFIDAVAPRVAVVQAAYRSRFGQPAAAVVASYTARGVIVLRCDRCGAWSLPADATDGSWERKAAPRYWHHPAGAPTVPAD